MNRIIVLLLAITITGILCALLFGIARDYSSKEKFRSKHTCVGLEGQRKFIRTSVTGAETSKTLYHCNGWILKAV